MTFEAWLAFAMMNLIYSTTPGPNAALLLAASSKGGLRAGAGALAGTVLAEATWAGVAVLIVSGTLGLITTWADMLEAFGPCALILIGLSMLRKRGPSAGTKSQALPSGGDMAIRRAAVSFFVGATNPLTMVFYVSIAPTFLAETSVSPLSAIAFVSAAVISCAAAYAPYIGFARLARPGVSALIERVCGCVLCIIGLVGLVSLAT